MSNQKIPFLASLCLFLSAIEYAIPKPLPFLRIGLANLPIIISLGILNPGEFILLVLFKILAQALISGTLFSYVFVFSAAGSTASALTMALVYFIFKKTHLVSNLSYSLAGALANNFAQLLCSKVMVFGDNTKYIAPVLLVSGLVTGTILGIFTNIFEEKSIWYREFKTDAQEDFSKAEAVLQKVSRLEAGPVIVFLLCLVSMIVFLFIESLWIKWFITAVFLIILLIKKHGKVRLLPSILVTVTVTLFALLDPNGKVLLKIGAFKVTEGALEAGLMRSATLVGMVFISQTAVNRNLQLPGKAGNFVSQVFGYFESLTKQKIKFTDKNIIKALDNHLLRVWKTE